MAFGALWSRLAGLPHPQDPVQVCPNLHWLSPKVSNGKDLFPFWGQQQDGADGLLVQMAKGDLQNEGRVCKVESPTGGGRRYCCCQIWCGRSSCGMYVLGHMQVTADGSVHRICDDGCNEHYIHAAPADRSWFCTLHAHDAECRERCWKGQEGLQEGKGEEGCHWSNHGLCCCRRFAAVPRGQFTWGLPGR